MNFSKAAPPRDKKRRVALVLCLTLAATATVVAQGILGAWLTYHLRNSFVSRSLSHTLALAVLAVATAFPAPVPGCRRHRSDAVDMDGPFDSAVSASKSDSLRGSSRLDHPWKAADLPHLDRHGNRVAFRKSFAQAQRLR